MKKKVSLHKGGKFLKKLWCSFSGRVEQGNLILSTELIMQIGHGKEFQNWNFDCLPFLRMNDKGRSLEMSALKLLTVANSVDNTKLSHPYRASQQAIIVRALAWVLHHPQEIMRPWAMQDPKLMRPGHGLKLVKKKS